MKRAAIFGLLIYLTMVSPTMASDTIVQDNLVNKTNCPIQTLSTEDYDAVLTPIRDQVGKEWLAFNLEVTNKTDKELMIDWNKTYYLRHGKPSGKFAFGGQQLGARDMDAARKPDVIPPHGTISKVIWPETRFYFSGQSQGWFNMPMTAGDQGVYLSLKTGDQQEARQKIVLNLEAQEKICSLPNSIRR